MIDSNVSFRGHFVCFILDYCGTFYQKTVWFYDDFTELTHQSISQN